jgi:hypothetical protein
VCDKVVGAISHSASSLGHDAGDGSSGDDDLGTKLFPLFPHPLHHFLMLSLRARDFFRKMQSARAPTEFI